MFLKELHLKYFKNLNDVSISFADNNSKSSNSVRKWTFILGENGTGKSSVLKAIALLLAGSDALGELIGDPDEWIKYGENSCEISATLINSDNEERHISLKINRNDDLKTLLSRSYDSLEEIDAALQYTKRNYFIVGYGANRKLANKYRSNSPRDFYMSFRANSMATIFHREATLKSLEDWAIDLDYTSDNRGIEIIRETLNNFLPEVSFDHIDKERKKLIFQTQDGKIPLNNLSEGYQNMASLIGDILYQLTKVFKDHNKPLEARGVLLIDEIELHLHPIWQRQLIKLLNKILPNIQIICTTHSPLTSQQAKQNELFILKRNETKLVEIVEYSGNPSLLPISELLISDVFGLETDESLMLEDKKKRYLKLKQKGDLTRQENSEFNELKEFLIARPHEAQSERDRAQFELIEKLAKIK